MYELILEQRYSASSGGTAAYASAAIGQELFAGLMMVVTLLVVLLAPAFTAGAISLEREKQTLDLLVTTPISSFSIVFGKLLSALTYVFILIAASVPMTAVVFVFGGVGPDDVIRGYIVLFATAFGLGAFGLFCSSLVKRTQAATVITTFGVMAITLGSIFVLVFWGAMTQPRFGEPSGGFGPIKGRPPEAIAYLNPFLAMADVVCTTQTTYGSYCARLAGLLTGSDCCRRVLRRAGHRARPHAGRGMDRRRPRLRRGDAARLSPRDVIPVQQFGVSRNAFWPRSVAAWLVLSAILIAISVQLVSPTRRWRMRLRRPRRAA